MKSRGSRGEHRNKSSWVEMKQVKGEVRRIEGAADARQRGEEALGHDEQGKRKEGRCDGCEK